MEQQPKRKTEKIGTIEEDSQEFDQKSYTFSNSIELKKSQPLNSEVFSKYERNLKTEEGMQSLGNLHLINNDSKIKIKMHF